MSGLLLPVKSLRELSETIAELSLSALGMRCCDELGLLLLSCSLVLEEKDHILKRFFSVPYTRCLPCCGLRSAIQLRWVK